MLIDIIRTYKAGKLFVIVLLILYDVSTKQKSEALLSNLYL